MQEVPVTKIRPSKGWQPVNFSEIIRYRDLLYFLTVRGIKAKYAQSVLGVGWAVIQPLFMTLIFTIVFGRLAGISSEGAPYVLFSLSAMIPWNYFSGTLTDTSQSMVANANMLSKVYFPRLVLPSAVVLSRLLDLLIGLVVLAVFLVFYKVVPSWEVVMLPILLLILLMLSLGLGLVLAAMSVQYRDIRHMTPFMVQLLMFAAPVVYPCSSVPEKWQMVYALNPLVGVIEGFRSALLGTTSFPWAFVFTGACTALLLFIFGLFYFSRAEKSFADLV
jgi:lipopolysaccharide transport system permease protein